MRVAALSIVGVVVAGKPMSCNEGAADAEPAITVTYEIPVGPGQRGIDLRGDCGGVVNGGILEVSPWQGRCEIVGWRKDGQLEVESAPVPLFAEQLHQHVAFDDLPSGPIGGMGALVHNVPGGIRISGVLPARPAALAGLRSDDRILAVGGRSTEGMSSTDFVRALTGPVGETVSLSVSREGRCAEEIEIVRARIE